MNIDPELRYDTSASRMLALVGETTRTGPAFSLDNTRTNTATVTTSTSPTPWPYAVGSSNAALHRGHSSNIESDSEEPYTESKDIMSKWFTKRESRNSILGHRQSSEPALSPPERLSRNSPESPDTPSQGDTDSPETTTGTDSTDLQTSSSIHSKSPKRPKKVEDLADIQVILGLMRDPSTLSSFRNSDDVLFQLGRSENLCDAVFRPSWMRTSSGPR